MAATTRVQLVQGAKEKTGASRARGRAPSVRSAGGRAGASAVVRDVAAFVLDGQRPGVRSAPVASGSEIGDVVSSPGAPLLQPLRAEREARLGADCGHELAERPAVQRSSVHDVLRSAGRPLDDSTRTDMEFRLGADFSQVRIHDDTAARTSASELGARAYTSGHHVVIGDGDKHTLAHELTHVIQQRQGPVSGTDNGSGLSVSDPSDRFEREAETNARRAMSKPQPLQHSVAQAAHADRSVTELPVQRMPKVTKETTESEEPKAKRARTDKGKVGGQSQVKELLIKELTDRWGWKTHGGGQSLTLHLTNALEETKKTAATKVEQIYGASNNIRKPKSYKNNRTMQSMRWISTLAKDYLDRKNPSNKAEEVQATVIGTTMYISANQNKHNTQLGELAAKHNTGEEFARALVADLGKPETDATDRFSRHAGKLSKRVANDGTGDYAEIASKKVAVPEDVPKADDGLHAERRLGQLAGFDPKMTIGIKRPCVVCYSQLYAVVDAELVGGGNLKVYPGPLWPSKAANKGMASYEEKSVRRASRSMPSTSMKRCRRPTAPTSASPGQGSIHGTRTATLTRTPEFSSAGSLYGLRGIRGRRPGARTVRHPHPALPRVAPEHAHRNQPELPVAVRWSDG
ncbi:DUF4157 domain-containing protein [Saccharopolyspora spinosa]|uniref:eCIS core domain-containing protein n=1 Tax=Saccharopolyspora spinosa TaxID=60894 RepID=UPI000A056647|nr:DUF4157 domain-containing protein [Saccharopolyspora spinosa]